MMCLDNFCFRNQHLSQGAVRPGPNNRQLQERRDELSENISKLSIADEEVSRLLAKADEAANRAVAVQSSVHPDNDGSHLR